MDRIYSRLIWFIEKLLAIMVAILTVVVAMGVFFRYVLSDSLPWTDEVSGYLLAWITFMSAITALERGKHINFDGILMVVPPKARRVLEMVGDVFLFGFLVVLVVYGFQASTQLMNQTAISFDMPMGVIYSVVPISALLMMVVLVYRWFVPRKFATGLKAEIAEATE